MSSYEALKGYEDDIFKNLDLQIDTKQQELTELTKEYENKETDLKISTNQAYREHAYNKALEVLEEHEEIAISEDKYEGMKEELVELRDKLEAEVEKAIAMEKQKGTVALKAAVANCELQHKAEVAEIRATSMQKEGQVEMLMQTIDSMKEEIAEQRKLTQAVAEASKQGAISQNFGKQ